MNALSQEQPADHSAARLNMIENQLRPNKIRDERILGAMENLPRELFVPQSLAGIAYADENIAVAPGRYLLEPMVQARMIQEAGIGPGDRVLDVGAATGYSTAVLAALAKDVVAIESDAVLHQRAAQNLPFLQIGNAEVRLIPLTQGWKTGAPYDVILINGGVEVVPDSLLSQLAEGGRLVAIVRSYGPAHAAHTGQACLYEKTKDSVASRPLFDANAGLLPGFAAPATFVF